MAFYTVNGQLAFLPDGETPPWAAGTYTAAKDPNAPGITDAYLKSDAYAQQKAADAAKAKREAATRVNANPTATPQQLASYDSYWAGSSDLTPSQVDSRLTAALMGNGDAAANLKQAGLIDQMKVTNPVGNQGFGPKANTNTGGIVNNGTGGTGTGGTGTGGTGTGGTGTGGTGTGGTGTGGTGTGGTGAGGTGTGGTGTGGTGTGGTGTGGTGTSVDQVLAGGPGAPAVAQDFATLQAGLTPTTSGVGAQETVQGQLQQIMQEDNPLFQQARERARKVAESRGLLNSSIAAQAGEEAMLTVAMDIAKQDATAYFNRAQANQDVLNDFKKTQFIQGTDLLKAYEEYKQKNALFDKDAKLQKILQDDRISSAEKINALNNATQLEASRISAASQQATAQTQANATLTAATMQINANKEIQAANIAANKWTVEANNKAQLDSNLMNAKVAVLNGYTQAITSVLQGEYASAADRTNAINTVNSIYGGVPNNDLITFVNG